ncbi:MAG: ferrous iron transport protein B, partial [Anaerotignum sp.]|nr:ferrous iron transport protein B [Anaerotignum sp.]
MIFALAGNQNCGKTTLFNQLTGSNQHVGNFPGVTVDQKMGEVRGEKNCSVVDLPGIYSIRPYTAEEIVTRDFILNEKPDGIINIVDATNIERNLYLTLQLIEMRIPMVLALNMMDEVRNNGGTIDINRMSEELGIPVVPISAVKNEGIDELMQVAVKAAKNKEYPKVYDFCPAGPVHRCIHSVCHQIEDHAEKAGIPVRFAAAKLIEGDSDIAEKLALDQNELELIEHSIIQMEEEHDMDRNAALADMRYDFIEKVCAATVIKPQESKEHMRSVRIDSVLTHKYLSLPIFVGVMFLIFYLTFNVIGAYLSDLLAAGIDGITAMVDTALANYGINPVVHSLVIDGVFAGVGSVLSFLPIIVVLFFFLSILEDTGYMARIAFVMDKLLRKIGLSGRSIVPLLIGFGCTVPAVMATRTLSSERDRRMTILLTPFMSCSAKIPIYGVFSAAFFPEHAALVMIGLYVAGIVAGIIIALIFDKTVFRGKPVPFVMELPNYRFPSMKSVVLLMWDKAKDFLQRAFTVIFVATIIIWFLQSFDTRLNVVADSADSLLAMLGHWLAPIFAPLGFNDWRIPTALITGFSAKEAVVSTLGVLMGTSMEGLEVALGTLFTPISAISFLIFTLLYTPCMAAVA